MRKQFNIAGITFRYKEDPEVATMRPSGIAQLEPEPDNRFDPNAIKVIIDGQQNIIELKIDPEAVDPEDVEMLEDMVLAAVAEAMRKSRDLAEERLGAFTKGMKIPGLM